MLVRIYALVWLLVATTIGIVYFSGYVNELTMIVFGFVVSALTFMGIIAVLPWWVSQPYATKY